MVIQPGYCEWFDICVDLAVNSAIMHVQNFAIFIFASEVTHEKRKVLHHVEISHHRVLLTKLVPHSTTAFVWTSSNSVPSLMCSCFQTSFPDQERSSEWDWLTWWAECGPWWNEAEGTSQHSHSIPPTSAGSGREWTILVLTARPSWKAHQRVNLYLNSFEGEISMR